MILPLIFLEETEKKNWFNLLVMNVKVMDFVISLIKTK